MYQDGIGTVFGFTMDSVVLGLASCGLGWYGVRFAMDSVVLGLAPCGLGWLSAPVSPWILPC